MFLGQKRGFVRLDSRPSDVSLCCERGKREDLEALGWSGSGIDGSLLLSELFHSAEIYPAFATRI